MYLFSDENHESELVESDRKEGDEDDKGRENHKKTLVFQIS